MIAIPFLMGAAAGVGAYALGASAFLTMAAFTVGSMLGNYLLTKRMKALLCHWFMALLK